MADGPRKDGLSMVPFFIPEWITSNDRTGLIDALAPLRHDIPDLLEAGVALQLLGIPPDLEAQWPSISSYTEPKGRFYIYGNPFEHMRVIGNAKTLALPTAGVLLPNTDLLISMTDNLLKKELYLSEWVLKSLAYLPTDDDLPYRLTREEEENQLGRIIFALGSLAKLRVASPKDYIHFMKTTIDVDEIAHLGDFGAYLARDGQRGGGFWPRIKILADARVSFPNKPPSELPSPDRERLPGEVEKTIRSLCNLNTEPLEPQDVAILFSHLRWASILTAPSVTVHRNGGLIVRWDRPSPTP